MTWTPVTITTLTTITAANLNEMRGNAQHLRDDLVGRVLAQAPSEFFASHGVINPARLRFDVGALTWWTDWTLSDVYIPLPGNVTNLDAGGLSVGSTTLVVTVERDASSGNDTELFRLQMFISADIQRLSFFGEMKVINSGAPADFGAWARSITAVGSYSAGLAAAV